MFDLEAAQVGALIAQDQEGHEIARRSGKLRKADTWVIGGDSPSPSAPSSQDRFSHRLARGIERTTGFLGPDDLLGAMRRSQLSAIRALCGLPDLGSNVLAPTCAAAA